MVQPSALQEGDREDWAQDQLYKKEIHDTLVISVCLDMLVIISERVSGNTNDHEHR